MQSISFPSEDLLQSILCPSIDPVPGNSLDAYTLNWRSEIHWQYQHLSHFLQLGVWHYWIGSVHREDSDLQPTKVLTDPLTYISVSEYLVLWGTLTQTAWLTRYHISGVNLIHQHIWNWRHHFLRYCTLVHIQFDFLLPILSPEGVRHTGITSICLISHSSVLDSL